MGKYFIHDKAFTIENNEVTHFNIEMNGFELNTACAVTMNGQSYIFQAAKQSDLYGKQYVLLLGRVRRLLFTVSFLLICLSNLDLDPNSRDLTYYSKMKDMDRLSTCINWSPGAIGKYRID